jgi:uncharacterized membrane protein
VAVVQPDEPGHRLDQEAIVPEHLVPIVESRRLRRGRNVVMGRCSMCHNAEPVWPGINWAPRGVRLDTEAEIARYATVVYLQAGASHAMPPGNVTAMDDEERALIMRWYRELRAGSDNPLLASAGW